ncbi:transmembrane protein 59-like isoform X3 [Lepidochelys kempii]|uniref:transmembrane protein 59-like isoform X3 n=1 Tax=Lepidochelys kempii TaxID=8472 RepID=UPI003C6FCC7A
MGQAAVHAEKQGRTSWVPGRDLPPHALVISRETKPSQLCCRRLSAQGAVGVRSRQGVLEEDHPLGQLGRLVQGWRDLWMQRNSLSDGRIEEQFALPPLSRLCIPESLELQPVSFSMFDLVSSFCNDIVSSAQSFISSTWTFYLQADDGKVVVFQSQPEIEYPVPEMPAPKSELMEKSWPVSSPNTLRPHTGRKEKLEKPPMKEPKSKTKFQHVETHQPEHDFLGCMSKRGVVGCYRRSGLPRWILAACLFLSIMVMLWLSCASLVTAPDQHVKTQTLSINGDKEDLENLDGSAPFSLHPVIAVTICPADDNEEAGPLPVKVDLDKTVL